MGEGLNWWGRALTGGEGLNWWGGPSLVGEGRYWWGRAVTGGGGANTYYIYPLCRSMLMRMIITLCWRLRHSPSPPLT